MKVAVPEWQGRVSPVFDVAEQLLVVNFGTSGDLAKQSERLGRTTPRERVLRLAQLGVEVLVCGAISRPLETLVTASGIRTVSFVCGDVWEVLAAFRDGSLTDERFAMPGCCRKRRRVRGRTCRGDRNSTEEIP